MIHSTDVFVPNLFTPTEEHQMLRESVRSFVDREDMDKQAEVYDEKECLNLELFQKVADEGWLGVTIPEDDGGLGMDATAAVIVHHELSKSDPGFCLAYLAHAMLFVNNFYQSASREQIDRYLAPTLDGTWIGAMAMTEPNYGTDVLGMTTTAVRDGDDYVITGTKTYITNGPEAHIFIVYAKVEGRISSFLITRDCPGLSTSHHIPKMGMRTSSMSEVIMENCRVPAFNILGDEGGGITHMMRNLEIERLALAAMSLGIADRCVELMVQYGNERKAFGQPINRFGQIQRFIGEDYALLEAMRCLIYNEAIHVRPDTNNRLGSDASKLFAAPYAKKIADDCMQVYGGAGYCREFPIERLLRDAKLLEIGGGTLESHQKNICKDLSKMFARQGTLTPTLYK
jgi:isovaleryl-CoA dehydrogenase